MSRCVHAASLAALLAGACYAPPALDECKVRCAAGDGGLCPEGSECRLDGFCHTPAQTTTCGAMPPGAQFIAFDVGTAHACGLRDDQSLWCWGINEDGAVGDATNEDRGAPVRVGSASDWLAVSAGGHFTCGIRAPGDLYCWGYNGVNELGIGASGIDQNEPRPVGADTGTVWKQVSAGLGQACARDAADTLYCWGHNDVDLGTGMTSASTPQLLAGTWTDIGVGAAYACGIKTNGELHCWGSNYEGRLGDGSGMDHGLPMPVDGNTDWEQLAVGPSHSCALRAGGQLYCWGRNSSGQVGNDNQMDQLAATPVGGAGGPWTSITANGFHTCGVRGSALFCWGAAQLGELGNGGRVPQFTPVPVAAAETWSAVAAGEFFTCAQRTDGALYCFGLNDHGQLGAGPPSTKRTPTRVGQDVDWARVAGGVDHTCGIRAGDLYCWGLNSSGQLGTGDTMDRYTPALIGIGYRDVAVGLAHSCAIDTMGRLYCWGNDDLEQQGNGDGAMPWLVPTEVMLDTTWSLLSAGWGFTCGARTTGGVYCWGQNDQGQMANGAVGGAESSPLLVDSGGFQALSAGPLRACGVRAATGELICWGNAADNSLPSVPPLPPPLTALTAPTSLEPTRAPWHDVTLGDKHGCATQPDGALWCWGYNQYGEVGDGTSDPHPSAFKLSAPGEVYELVGAGRATTCVREPADDALWCAGDNADGELGDGGSAASAFPLQPGGPGLTWAGGGVGWQHVCGIQLDTSLWCWGKNDTGQLGDGTGSRTLPVAVIETR